MTPLFLCVASTQLVKAFMFAVCVSSIQCQVGKFIWTTGNDVFSHLSQQSLVWNKHTTEVVVKVVEGRSETQTKT